ncbi:hypothetical protein TNCV_1587561 [Trichonephila clavipes]|uniref:Uncharacterized protein n=1 Tax=Trichonephila clavipes TaxID=2585209 RepID=A0A8X6REK6_TRICX|nr:hypothetical protein TNCV_1587561 [Trichonephila clavipes]
MPPDLQRPDQGPRNSSWQRAKLRMSLAVALSTIQIRTRGITETSGTVNSMPSLLLETRFHTSSLPKIADHDACSQLNTRKGETLLLDRKSRGIRGAREEPPHPRTVEKIVRLKTPRSSIVFASSLTKDTFGGIEIVKNLENALAIRDVEYPRCLFNPEQRVFDDMLRCRP